MKLFIFLSVIALVKAQCSSDDVLKCNTIGREIEAEKWPQNVAEVKALCDRLLAGGRCLGDFAEKCLKPRYAFLVFEVLDREKQILENSICGPGIDQFLGDVKGCFSKAEVISGLRDTHRRYVSLVEAAEGFERWTYRQSVCCTQLYNFDAVVDLTSDQCGNEAAHRLKELVKSSVIKEELSAIFGNFFKIGFGLQFGDIFHKVCGESVNSYQACYDELPGGLKKAFMSITEVKDAPEPKRKYAVVTLMEMFKSLLAN